MSFKETFRKNEIYQIVTFTYASLQNKDSQATQYEIGSQQWQLLSH